MVKAIQDFLFGIFFGMGFMVSVAVLRFIVGLLSGAGHPVQIP